MALEIRELVIKVSVHEKTERTPLPAAQQIDLQRLKESIVQECLEAISESSRQGGTDR